MNLRKAILVVSDFCKMAISVIVLFLIGSAQLLGVQGTQLAYEWVSFTPGLERLPENAIAAGYDLEGSLIYISQMRVEREKIPSQLIPAESSSYAVYENNIYKSPLTAVPTPILCGKNYGWVQASLDSFPKNAIPCGKSENGDILYVGRAEYNGSTILGAVAPTRSALFAAFEGTEVRWFGTYKVLVYDDIDQWKFATYDDFPEDAVAGGYDRDRQPLYVGIMRIGSQVVPAQINPEARVATASYSGGIAESDDFQVLVGSNYKWAPVKKGKIPANVVVAGRTAKGEALYAGRAVYRKQQLTGSVSASDKVLYINYLGKLRTVESTYEVLINTAK